MQNISTVDRTQLVTTQDDAYIKKGYLDNARTGDNKILKTPN